jgi:hypothetical protein
LAAGEAMDLEQAPALALRDEPLPTPNRLTRREPEVAALLAEGCRTADRRAAGDRRGDRGAARRASGLLAPGLDRPFRAVLVAAADAGAAVKLRLGQAGRQVDLLCPTPKPAREAGCQRSSTMAAAGVSGSRSTRH